MGVLDSTAGSVFASTLHTAGAIAFLAGLMVYVAWSRGVRRGDEHIQLHTLGATLTYVAILANLMGGFMRTYAPGHPKFWELFDEPWAMLMVIKHVFLFAGMFAAVYLFEVIGPRLRRGLKAGKTPKRSGAEATAVGFTASAILIATLLGAMAAVTAIGDPMPEPEPTDPTTPPANPGAVLFEEDQYWFNGTLTSLPPVQPGTSDGRIDLPKQVGQLDAILSWTDSLATLTFQLEAPNGTVYQSSLQGDSQAVTITNPSAGAWKFTVTGENAVNVDYTFTAVLVPGEGDQQMISGTYVIPSQTIFEINMVAPLHGNISWEWTTSADSPFNLHTHFDGEVQYIIEKTASSDAARYMVKRTGGHSIMWENPGAAPITLSYQVWGNFEVDSYFPVEP